MARRVVVLCDVHLEEGERVEAEELPPITVEGKSARILALCPEHKHDYYDPFVELVDDLGVDASDEGTTKAIHDKAPSAGAQPDEGSEDTTDDDSGERDENDQAALAVTESPTMTVVDDDTARWDCPVDDCDKQYSAAGEHRAEDLKRLGNLHLSTAHGLDKGERREVLSA